MVYQPKNQYEWAAFKYPVNANVVGAVIEEIEQRDGAITKEAFLEESTPEDSPTHSLFEWDDKIAAHKYRLDTAQKVILSIRVKASEDEDTETRYSAFVNISEGRNAVYLNINDAMRQEETRAVVLKKAMREMNTFCQKYSNLKEFSKVFAAYKEMTA